MFSLSLKIKLLLWTLNLICELYGDRIFIINLRFTATVLFLEIECPKIVANYGSLHLSVLVNMLNICNQIAYIVKWDENKFKYCKYILKYFVTIIMLISLFLHISLWRSVTYCRIHIHYLYLTKGIGHAAYLENHILFYN